MYKIYSLNIFYADAGHYPLYCLTKRHYNEEEDLKLWTSPSKECLAITLVRSDKKIKTMQSVKSQLILLIEDL